MPLPALPLLERFDQSLARYESEFTAARSAGAGQPLAPIPELLARLAPVLQRVREEFPEIRQGQSMGGDVAVMAVHTASLRIRSTLRLDPSGDRFLRRDEIDLDPWRLRAHDDSGPVSDPREFSYATMDEALASWVDWLAWLAALLRSERPAAASEPNAQGL